MTSIKKRIAELKIARTKIEYRPMTNAEKKIRVMNILSNPDSLGYHQLLKFFDGRSEVFRRMRLK